MVKRDILMKISVANGLTLADAEQAFTLLLLLSHNYHELQEPFDIMDLHTAVDMILPNW